jgi:hypothetical protein
LQRKRLDQEIDTDCTFGSTVYKTTVEWLVLKTVSRGSFQRYFLGSFDHYDCSVKGSLFLFLFEVIERVLGRVIEPYPSEFVTWVVQHQQIPFFQSGIERVNK